MRLYEELNFQQEFSWLKLHGLSTLQRKLLIDLIRGRHPQVWSMLASHAYCWSTTKKHLNQFINNHTPEFTEELTKAGFNQNGFSENAEWKGRSLCPDANIAGTHGTGNAETRT